MRYDLKRYKYVCPMCETVWIWKTESYFSYWAESKHCPNCITLSPASFLKLARRIGDLEIELKKTQDFLQEALMEIGQYAVQATNDPLCL